MLKRLCNFSILLYALSLSLGITVVWTILLVGVCLAILKLFSQGQSKDNVTQLKNIFTAPLALAIGIFWLAVTVSGFANGGLSEAIKSFSSLRGFLVYFWAYYCFSLEPELKRRAVVCMLIIGSLAGFLAAFQQLTGFHPNSFPYLQGTGFLSGPMAFSGLAQIFSMLIFGLLIQNNYRALPPPFSRPAVFAILATGNALGLLFAGERSAWLGGMVALILSAFVVSWRVMLKTVIALSIAAALCWFAVPVVQQRLTPLVNWQTDVSAKVRLLLWRESILIFEKSPIFGVGIRQFPHFRIPEALGQGHVAIDHAHSNYLHILATTGIVGILSYVYLWISVLSLSLTNWKESNKDRLTPSADSAIYFGILAGAIALIVSGIFEYNFGTAQIRLTQWFLFAMLLPRRHVPDYKQK